MGSLNPCCISKVHDLEDTSNKEIPFFIKDHQEIIVDIPTQIEEALPSQNLNISTSNNQAAIIFSKRKNDITSRKISLTIKPERNKSSLLMKTNKHQIGLTKEIKRCNSSNKGYQEYKEMIDVRGCNFSKNQPTKISNQNPETIDNQQIYLKTSPNNTKNIKQETTESPFSHKRGKPRKNLEIINKPFTEAQLNFIKKILIDEEMIIDEMDESAINTIINCMSYIRIKPDYTLFNGENTKQLSSDKDQIKTGSTISNSYSSNIGQFYYIVERGKIEMSIDNSLYLGEKKNTISTKAGVKNTKKLCYLKSRKRAYGYKLPLDKYTSIFSDSVDKIQEEKFECIKKIFGFTSLDKRTLQGIANGCSKKKYNERTGLIEHGTNPTEGYIVLSGEVICLKGMEIVRKIGEGNLIGDMVMFTEIPSGHSYWAEKDSILYKLEFNTISKSGGRENYMKKLIQNIFTSAVSNSIILNKYFTENNIEEIFPIFQLKYYFNDTVFSKKTKKLFILLSGYLTEKPANKSKEDKNEKSQVRSESYLKGIIYGETNLSENVLYSHIISDECLVFEAQWSEILKSMHCYSNRQITGYDKMVYTRQVPAFKGINELQLFNLTENGKSICFRENDLIIKDGPISDKLYIIKAGKVKGVINDIEVKVLDPGTSFGDISSQVGAYNRKASFYAKTYLECYYIDKDVFEDIIDFEILKPFHKMLILKDITVSLEQLYYIKDLGQGSYGKVYLVHDTKRLYAMKTAEIQEMIQNKTSAQCYGNEKSIMSLIDHPFIVQLINTFKTREYIFFLIELVQGISLRAYLDSNRIHNNIRNGAETTFITGILCNTLSYLQKIRIIHRDLKPENLMIDSNGYIKVIDFGIAKNLSGKDSTHTQIGTSHYMAPEMVMGKNYSFAVDIWAIGVILYEFFYGFLPFGFGMKENQDIYQDIKERKPVLPYDPKLTNINAFLGELLNKNPNKRMMFFTKWKSHLLFSTVNFDFEILGKMEMLSPIKENLLEKYTMSADVLSNKGCPFHQFMRNNIFISSNDGGEMPNKEVEDYGNGF